MRISDWSSDVCSSDLVGARAGALAADEIAVARRGAAFARGHLVGIHRKAGRTARLAPFEAGVGEDAVEPLGFGLRLHQPRTGDADRPLDVIGLVPALDQRRGGPPVLHAAVGSAAAGELSHPTAL